MFDALMRKEADFSELQVGEYFIYDGEIFRKVIEIQYVDSEIKKEDHCYRNSIRLLDCDHWTIDEDVRVLPVSVNITVDLPIRKI